MYYIIGGKYQDSYRNVLEEAFYIIDLDHAL